MKKVVLGVLGIAFVSLYFSCSKDKTAPPQTGCTQTDSVNTYTNSVKAILDANCANLGCHESFTQQSGLILDTYDGAVAAAKGNSKFFCVIDWSCGPVMPSGKPKLADSLITKITAWKNNCYAQ